VALGRNDTGSGYLGILCLILGDTLFNSYEFLVSRLRNVLSLYDVTPNIGKGAFIAPNANVIGDTEIGENSIVWYGAMIRGDVNEIKVGKNTSIGDRSIVHTTRDTKKTGLKTYIGDFVTIGDGSIIHGCTIEDEVIIELGSTILDGSVVGKNSIVGPGSLVLPGTRVPTGEYWSGSPAKFVRKLSEDEISSIIKRSETNKELAQTHRELWHDLPEETKHQQLQEILKEKI